MKRTTAEHLVMLKKSTLFKFPGFLFIELLAEVSVLRRVKT